MSLTKLTVYSIPSNSIRLGETSTGNNFPERVRCFVSYIKEGSYRDEDPNRQTSIRPVEQEIKGVKIIYPKDQKAAGSWIAMDEENFTLCLLNGAYKKHTKLSRYRKSRGILLLDFFKYRDVRKFIEKYPFVGIEPFTLIIVKNRGGIELHQLIWDGVKLSHRELDSKKETIWSSVTLYGPAVRKKREQWFHDWLQMSDKKDLNGILKFHKTGGAEDPKNGLVMNRDNQVQTVSITSIDCMSSSVNFRYEDLLRQHVSEKKTDYPLLFIKYHSAI